MNPDNPVIKLKAHVIGVDENGDDILDWMYYPSDQQGIKQYISKIGFHEDDRVGYKLHICLDPSDYLDRTRDLVVNFLHQNAIAFKCVGDKRGDFTRSIADPDSRQYGKSFTLYPQSEEDFLKVAKGMRQLVKIHKLKGIHPNKFDINYHNMAFEIPIRATNNTLYYTVEKATRRILGEKFVNERVGFDSSGLTQVPYQERKRIMFDHWGRGELDFLWIKKQAPPNEKLKIPTPPNYRRNPMNCGCGQTPCKTYGTRRNPTIPMYVGTPTGRVKNLGSITAIVQVGRNIIKDVGEGIQDIYRSLIGGRQSMTEKRMAMAVAEMQADLERECLELGGNVVGNIQIDYEYPATGSDITLIAVADAFKTPKKNPASNYHKYEKKVISILKKEGGAAGLKALRPAFPKGTTKAKVVGMLKKMNHVVLHADGDYILIQGLNNPPFDMVETLDTMRKDGLQKLELWAETYLDGELKRAMVTGDVKQRGKKGVSKTAYEVIIDERNGGSELLNILNMMDPTAWPRHYSVLNANLSAFNNTRRRRTEGQIGSHLSPLYNGNVSLKYSPDKHHFRFLFNLHQGKKPKPKKNHPEEDEDPGVTGIHRFTPPTAQGSQGASKDPSRFVKDTLGKADMSRLKTDVPAPLNMKSRKTKKPKPKKNHPELVCIYKKSSRSKPCGTPLREKKNPKGRYACRKCGAEYEMK